MEASLQVVVLVEHDEAPSSARQSPVPPVEQRAVPKAILRAAPVGRSKYPYNGVVQAWSWCTPRRISEQEPCPHRRASRRPPLDVQAAAVGVRGAEIVQRRTGVATVPQRPAVVTACLAQVGERITVLVLLLLCPDSVGEDRLDGARRQRASGAADGAHDRGEEGLVGNISRVSALLHVLPPSSLDAFAA